MCLIRFPPAAASYILLQFAQYGNILRHTVRCTHTHTHTPLPTALAVEKTKCCKGHGGINCTPGWQMASPGNWMHLQYQSKLQARKALSKDGKVFGDAIMVGVKPCIDKVGSSLQLAVARPLHRRVALKLVSVVGLQAVMDSSSVAVSSPLSTPSSALPSTPHSAMRPLAAAYRSSGGDYQVTHPSPRVDNGSLLIPC